MPVASYKFGTIKVKRAKIVRGIQSEMNQGMTALLPIKGFSLAESVRQIAKSD